MGHWEPIKGPSSVRRIYNQLNYRELYNMALDSLRPLNQHSNMGLFLGLVTCYMGKVVAYETCQFF